MPETSTTEESMISYYIETSDGLFRLNVPKSWSISIDHTRNGVVVAAFSDENDSVRQLFTGVATIRDSSAMLQTLTPVENQPEGEEVRYLWQDQSINQPLSRYTAENITASTRRRRRIQLQEDSIDDGLDFLD